jgi:hypothetical protein
VERHGVLHELAVVAALGLCIGCQNRASQPEQRAASRAVSSAGAGLSQLAALPSPARQRRVALRRERRRRLVRWG